MSNCKTQSDSWQPCYASPEKGIAFFDGVVIESDPITDPRYDRVLPVLEEEQVFMCRQMLPVLEEVKKGTNNRPLVLDVGTGSGVFAIWAAKHGCNVVAIDINPRAMRLAKQNVRKNNLCYADRFNELSDNAPIVFLEEKFDAYFANKLDFKEKFDIVFLAPPYNPTCPGIIPALHAEAGEDGQQCFDEQIKYVPALLIEGGYCIGNQMTMVFDQNIAARDIIRKAFNGLCEIEYTRIIENDIRVREFLGRQYKTHLGSSNKKMVEDYIDRVSGENKFSLIYYQIKKDNKFKCEELSYKNRVSLGMDKCDWWDKRIWLHKQIVDNIGTRDYFSIPALFLKNVPSFIKVKDEKPNDDLAEKLENSPLKLIDNYINAKSNQPLKKSQSCFNIDRNSGETANGQRFLNIFDLICIDSGPIYPSFERKKRYIKAETKMWIDDKYTYKILNQKWQLNTQKFQKSMMAPFLHPSFVGLFTKEVWTNMDYTFIEDETKLYVDNEELDRLSQYEQWFKDNGQIQGNANADDIIYSDFLKYSRTALGRLSVPNPAEYWETLDNPQRLPFPKMIKGGVIPSSIIKKYSNGGVFSALKRNNLELEEKNLLIDILQEDLRICHYEFHKSIHSIFKEQINYKWSALIGLPLAIETLRDYADKDRVELPESYKGGLWIFAASNDEFTLKHEKELFNLARFTWLIYMERISKEFTKQMGKDTREELERNLKHELKHISKAISNMWMCSPNDKLKSAINRENDFLSKLNWKILPFPELYRTAGNMIRLWVGTDDVIDVFDEAPNTFKEFIVACYKLSCFSYIPFEFRGYSLENTNNYKRIRQALKRAEHAVTSTLIFNGDMDTPNPIWKRPSWMTLTRLVTAVFTNCIKHGDLTQKMTVNTRIEKSHLVIEITNEVREKESYAETNKFSLLHWHGTDVIKSCYKELNPNAVYDEPKEKDNAYPVTFLIPLSIIT